MDGHMCPRASDTPIFHWGMYPTSYKSHTSMVSFYIHGFDIIWQGSYMLN